MTANLKRYTIGERVKEWPANSWNRIVDAVEQATPINPLGELGGITQNVVPVKNVSTTDIPKGGVMMPTGSLLDISDGEKTASYGAMLAVDVPDLSLGAEATYMIAVSPVDQGVIGSGTMMGPVWARVDIRDVTDKYAQVIDGDATKLESTASGSRARIIAKESGTGELWALILLTPYRLRIRKGIVNSTGGQTEIPPDADGTVDVYQLGIAIGEENTWNLDWVGDEAISTGLECMAADFEDENIFSIFAAQCEPIPAAAPPGDGDSIQASVTQTRGQSPLSYRVNRVTIIANNNDVVTLPSASAFVQGDDCIIQNADATGSNTLQIFPSGASDTINGGSPGASETLAFGLSVKYFLVRTGHWIS